MAAGLGSRFGGTKQLVPVGKHGETLLDFTIQDALRVGMTDVVIIVRSEIVNDMKSHVERLHLKVLTLGLFYKTVMVLLEGSLGVRLMP